jgi:hypothetical protein
VTRLVRKVDLAQIANVTKASITMAARKAFPGAMVGLRVDVDHADVQRYLAGKPGALTRLAEFFARGGAPAAHTPAPSSTPAGLQARVPQRTGAERRFSLITNGAAPATIDIEAAMHMELRKIVEQWGSLPQFVDALDAVRRMTEIKEREIKIAKELGRLVSRELVRSAVFSHLEAMNRKMFGETALTAARRVHQIGRAGQPVEEAEALMRELFKQAIQPAKAGTTRALRALGTVDHVVAPEPEGAGVAHE